MSRSLARTEVCSAEVCSAASGLVDRSVSCHVSEWAGQLLDTSYTAVSRSAVGLRSAGLLPEWM